MTSNNVIDHPIAADSRGPAAEGNDELDELYKKYRGPFLQPVRQKVNGAIRGPDRRVGSDLQEAFEWLPFTAHWRETLLG